MPATSRRNRACRSRAIEWSHSLDRFGHPPDAVSARAVLQRVKLPRRLATLSEGESLLNDATGLVLCRFAVAAVVTGTFSFGEAIGSFAFLVGGGIAVGGAIGAAWILLLRRLGDFCCAVRAYCELSLPPPPPQRDWSVLN